MTSDHPTEYVTRGGFKLAAALDAFGINPAGWVCADLGSNVGGFVDCLLRRGAARVYAIDTGYGVLAYKLRRDSRVVVMERTNAMHLALPESVDLVTVDVAWTPQHHILPNALRQLRPGGRIITLIKPHYEADKTLLHKGVLDPDVARQTLNTVCGRIPDLGLTVVQTVHSPMLGTKGNVEFLALLALVPPTE
jgi:23S rRNA (cytidine1920-2'-O)/16S rRNA (cytidine1409-2'-O)-methyltransferase